MEMHLSRHQKTEEATERFSFNTGVSALMIGVNELTDLKCTKKDVLEKLVVILAPYAPHVAEELWHILGNESSVLDAPYPKVEEKYLVESSKNYPSRSTARPAPNSISLWMPRNNRWKSWCWPTRS